MTFRTYLSGYSRLPLRDRALITLRSAHLSGANHLLASLALTALDHGLQPSDIQLIKTGHQAEGWTKRETLLLQAVNDLHYQQKISQKLWKTLSQVYDPGQILDFTLCSGAFHLCQHP
ncbi:MAG: hypothetical protein ACPG5T_08000, partial [Endozoicomonas sp.]